jgi:hypothetical protein
MEKSQLVLMAEALYDKCKKENCISDEKGGFVIGFLEGYLYNLNNNR